MAFAFPPGCSKDRDRAVFAQAVVNALVAYHNRQTDPVRREWAEKAIRIAGHWYSRHAQALGLQAADQTAALAALQAEAETQTKWTITDAMLEKLDYWADRAATQT